MSRFFIGTNEKARLLVNPSYGHSVSVTAAQEINMETIWHLVKFDTKDASNNQQGHFVHYHFVGGNLLTSTQSQELTTNRCIQGQKTQPEPC